MKELFRKMGAQMRIFCVCIAVALLIGVYYLISRDHTCLYLLPALMLAGCVYYAMGDYERNSFFLGFLICFFTFLLGRRFIYRLTGNYASDFSVRIETGTDIKLMVGLAGLLCGYALTDRFAGQRVRKCYRPKYLFRENGSDLQKLSKLFFYCAYPFWVYTVGDIILFVMRNSYAEYYVSYISSVPTLIRLIGKTAPMFFFVFLATMPERKEAIPALGLYLLYAVISLGTGRRLTFITSLLIVFAYCLSRNSLYPGKTPWISKKILVAMCAAVPVLLIVMYLFEYMRGSAAVGSASDNNPLTGFFIRQGVSVNVIKYAELYKNEMNPDARYSLYSTLKWLSDNAIAKLLGIEIPFLFGKQTEAVALQGTSLAHFVSYYANPENYLDGMGYGSSYIAELYADFGYFGILAGNLLYGAVLCGVFKYAPSVGWNWMYALGLFIADSMFVAPRASFDEFFVKLLYVECWAPLAGLMLLVYNKPLNTLFLGLLDRLTRMIKLLLLKIKKALLRNGKKQNN